MLLDLASRDGEFKEVTARMRRLMLNLLGGAKDYSVVPIQGGRVLCNGSRALFIRV